MEDRGVYISNKAASATGEAPTSSFVLTSLKLNPEIPSAWKTKFADKVMEITAHFSQPSRNMDDEFARKVYDLMAARSVSDRMIAFIVALPSMYEHLHDRTSSLLKIAEKYSTSNYIGEIGVRDTIMVKLLDVHEFHKADDSGVDQLLYIYRISDRIGNIGLFFSKNPPADNTTSTITKLPIKVWDCFEMKATPKKQMPNRETGVKETQFTRVRILEMIGTGTEE
jgi:hypothetical protein